MTVSEVTRLLSSRLEKVDTDAGAHEARIIMAYVLGIELSALPAYRQSELTEEQFETLNAMAVRRESHEPLQYIIGEWSFMGLTLFVNETVLIPRPETELLCEHAISIAKERHYRTALDLCTGSGCIAVALAAKTDLAVTASDISAECIAVAQQNARRNQVAISTRQSDLFDSITESFDCIVCNPPYLNDQDMLNMQQELCFEPVRALHGGSDGLLFYRRIAAAYRQHLNPGGALLMEIGSEQAAAVEALFEGAALHYDYQQLPRFVVIHDRKNDRLTDTGYGEILG